MRTLLGLTVGVMLIVPVPAAAQVVPSFEDLSTRLTVGDAIVVRDQSGRDMSGTLVELTADEIVIDRFGSRAPFRRQDVWQISRPRDPLWNGVVIGAVGGLGLGCLVGWNDYDPDSTFQIFSQGEACAIGGLVFGGIGAGIGAVGDLLWKNKPVYRTVRQLSLAPAVGIGRAGLQARLRW